MNIIYKIFLGIYRFVIDQYWNDGNKIDKLSGGFMNRAKLEQFVQDVKKHFEKWQAQNPWLTFFLQAPQLASDKMPMLSRAVIPDGLTREKAKPDGSCFYHAVVSILDQYKVQRQQSGENYNVKNLREDIARHISQDRERFLPFMFIEGDNGDFTDEERFQIKTEGIKGDDWADHLEIIALSEILQQPIIIIQSDGRITFPCEDRMYDGNDPIYLYFNPESKHYDALLPEANKNPVDILSTLKIKYADCIDIGKSNSAPMLSLRIKDINDKVRYGRFNDTFTCLPTWVECGYTLSKLIEISEQLLQQNNSADITDISKLINFLAERWMRIQNTNLAYPNNTVIASNICCTELAKLIAVSLTCEEKPLSSYKLLMPTLTELDHNMTGTDLKTDLVDDLEQKQGKKANIPQSAFILTDDNMGYIEVLECIEAGCNDGILKRQYQLGNDHVPISENEKMRLRLHSFESNDYLAALNSQRVYKNSDSFKSLHEEISRLSADIYESSTSGKGNEMKAADMVDTARVRFSNYLNTLPAEIKTKLFKSTLSDDIHNFEYVWSKRLRVDDKKETLQSDLSTDTCTYITSTFLQRFLEKNHWIYEYDQKETNSEKQKELDVANKREALKKIIDENCIFNMGYGEAGNQLLLKNMAINPDFQKYMFLFCICCVFLTSKEIENIFQSSANNKTTIDQLDEAVKDKINQIYGDPNKNGLKEIGPKIYALINLCKNAGKQLFDEATNKEIQLIIQNYIAAFGLDNNNAQFYDFIDFIGNADLETRKYLWAQIKNENIITRLFNLPEDYRFYNLAQISDSILIRLLLIFQILPEQECLDLAIFLGFNYADMSTFISRSSVEKRQSFLAQILAQTPALANNKTFVVGFLNNQIHGVNDLNEILARQYNLRLSDYDVQNLLTTLGKKWILKNSGSFGDFLSIIKLIPETNRLNFILNIFDHVTLSSKIITSCHLCNFLEALSEKDRDIFLSECDTSCIKLFFRSNIWIRKLLSLVPKKTYQSLMIRIKSDQIRLVVEDFFKSQCDLDLLAEILMIVPATYRSNFFNFNQVTKLIDKLKNIDHLMRFLTHFVNDSDRFNVTLCCLDYNPNYLSERFTSSSDISMFLHLMPRDGLDKLIERIFSSICKYSEDVISLCTMLSFLRKVPEKQGALWARADVIGLNKILKKSVDLLNIMHVLTEDNQRHFFEFFSEKYQTHLHKIFNSPGDFLRLIKDYLFSLGPDLINAWPKESLHKLFPTVDILAKSLSAIDINESLYKVVLNQFDADYFKSKIKTVATLTILLDSMPQQIRINFLQEKIGIDFLSRLTVKFSEHLQIANRFPAPITNGEQEFCANFAKLGQLLSEKERDNDLLLSGCCFSFGFDHSFFKKSQDSTIRNEMPSQNPGLNN